MKMRNYSQAAWMAVLLQAGTALADVYCPAPLGAVTIDDNVIVNGICYMTGTRVNGNVLVTNRGDLHMNGARVDGNVQADGSVSVRIQQSEVRGDIQLDNLSEGPSSVIRVSVGGNIQLFANKGQILTEYNLIGGDLQAFSNGRNFSNIGGVQIRYNTISGNLQCKSNNPPPTGGSNQVAGNKEDQCAALDSMGGPAPRCPVAFYDSTTGLASIPCILVDGSPRNQLNVDLAPPYMIASLLPKPAAQTCQQPSYDSITSRAIIPCLRLDGDPSNQYTVVLDAPYNVRNLTPRQDQ